MCTFVRGDQVWLWRRYERGCSVVDLLEGSGMADDSSFGKVELLW
jgi:hypothetical protein